MSETLTLKVLQQAVAGHAAAFRCVTEYQPAGGVGDKVFPPTYSGGEYATERRMNPNTGEPVDCVLLDSVQSQANRMEMALLEMSEAENCPALPLLKVAITGVPKPITITSLEAPHRVADAIFRDSHVTDDDGQQRLFKESAIRRRVLDQADLKNATGLFGLCPTALVFGVWDSTGPRGGLGAKFQRALVSEIVGYGAVAGVKPASRIDPLQIMKDAGPVFRTAGGEWTIDKERALKQGDKLVLYGLTKEGKYVLYDEGKKDQDEGNPAKLNHGNIPPSLRDNKTKQLLPGGFTLSHAMQTTVLSLSALRRLRFPLSGKTAEQQTVANLAARTVLAALGLAAATLSRVEGADLRSRCQLFPTGPFVWEVLDKPGAETTKFSFEGDQAVALLKGAIEAACKLGLPWEGVIELTPSTDLVELVRRSQVLAAKTSGDE